MSRKIALKRLTKSDLTIFDWQFRRSSSGNQKSINLNRDILEGKFYQNLTEVLEERDWEPFILNLTILGPGVSEEHTLPQKIIKGGTYKNWRLNGKLIPSPDPEGDDRYASLSEGDYAIMEFIGAAWPTSMRMTLVAAGLEEDRDLHAELTRRFSLNKRQSMITLGLEDLENSINEVGNRLPEDHPVRDFLEAFDLEDAAKGGPIGMHRLNRRRQGRGVSHQEFRKAKKAAEMIGRQGEEMLDKHFHHLKEKDEIMDYEWVADENAVAPFDFRLITSPEKTLLIDAKTTAGPFDNPLHISLSELREMKLNSHEYRIVRLYEVKEGFARMRISSPMREFAEEVIAHFDALPAGVWPDSISVAPETISFDDEKVLDFNDNTVQA